MFKKKRNKQLNIFLLKNWYILILLITIGIEVFGFNFRSWQSLFYKEVELQPSDYNTEALEEVDPETYRFAEETAVLYLIGLEEKTQGRKLHNILLELQMPDAVEDPTTESGILRIIPYMRDAGHDRYAVLAEHYLREDIPQSQYLWVSGAGPVKTLALQMKAETAQTVRIRRIVLNARQPLFIVWWRFLGVFLAGCIIYGLRRQSVLWRERGDLAKGIERGLFAALGGVLFIPGFSMVLKNESIKLHLSPYIYLLVMAASLLIYLGVYLFLRLLADRMERIPYAYLLLLTAGVTMGCQLPYFINQPDVGALQHVFIEMFFIWGIYLMFRFAYSKQEKDQKRYRGWLLLGVVCLILALIWWGVFQTAHEAEWSLYRLWEGVYGYWLKLPECTYVFPFMETVSEQRGGYRGMLFGGLLVSSPMVIILLALLRYTTEKKEYRAILLSSYILMGGAIFVFLMDVFTKRIDYPNIVDFALPVLLASAIAWMYFGKVFRDTYAESILRKGLCLLLGISVLYHANFIWYSGGVYPLAGGNTEMYYQLFYTFMFW